MGCTETKEANRSGDVAGTLSYFGIGARGEPLRILLAYKKVKYVDERLSFEQWGQIKQSGKFTAGQLPVWTENGN